ncbi:MAG: cytochrome b/b6 domain-containing protein [Alphaproteobacteria bacterium]
MDANGNSELRVWDAPTRLFHGCLIALFLTSWIAGVRGAMSLHVVSGCLILTLVLFRLVWGLIGSTTARFHHFLKPPTAVLSYLGDVRAGRSTLIAGHNPAGGWMIAAMLVVLLGQAGTGLFANDDVLIEGPLAHLVSDDVSDLLTVAHKALFKLLLAMVATHVSAALFYLWVKHDNLIRPMITGVRPWPSDQPMPQLRFASPLLAACVIAVAGLAVWLLVTRL